jgi:hypothetical protein
VGRLELLLIAAAVLISSVCLTSFRPMNMYLHTGGITVVVPVSAP